MGQDRLGNNGLITIWASTSIKLVTVWGLVRQKAYNLIFQNEVASCMDCSVTENTFFEKEEIDLIQSRAQK